MYSSLWATEAQLNHVRHLEGEVKVVDRDANGRASSAAEQDFQLLHQRALAGALRCADADHERRRRAARALGRTVLLELALAPEKDRQIVPENAKPVHRTQGLLRQGLLWCPAAVLHGSNLRIVPTTEIAAHGSEGTLQSCTLLDVVQRVDAAISQAASGLFAVMQPVRQIVCDRLCRDVAGTDQGSAQNVLCKCRVKLLSDFWSMFKIMFATHMGRQGVTCGGVAAPRSWSVIPKCTADFRSLVRCLTGRGTPCCLGGGLLGCPTANRVGSDASVVCVLTLNAVISVCPVNDKADHWITAYWLQMAVPASTNLQCITVAEQPQSLRCFVRQPQASAVDPMTSKEKKRVRWAETDDVFNEASTRAEKAPRLEDQSDGPAARDKAGAVPCRNPRTVPLLPDGHVEPECVVAPYR